MKDGLIKGAIIKKPTSILEVGAKLMLYFMMNLHVENKSIKILAYGSKWVFFSEKNTHSSSYRSFWVLNPL